MNPLPLALSIFLTVAGCSGFSSSLSTRIPREANEEFLYWCEQGGEWPVYVSKPACDTVSRGTWDHYPITVNASPSLLPETLVAIDSFNQQVGFTMFRYEIGNWDPDVGVIVSGMNSYALAEAKQMTIDGRHHGLVRVYNGMESDDREDIILHELGHIVGLRHDRDNKHSLMFPTSTYRVAVIERQDARALRAIYLGAE